MQRTFSLEFLCIVCIYVTCNLHYYCIYETCTLLCWLLALPTAVAPQPTLIRIPSLDLEGMALLWAKQFPPGGQICGGHGHLAGPPLLQRHRAGGRGSGEDCEILVFFCISAFFCTGFDPGSGQSSEKECVEHC